MTLSRTKIKELAAAAAKTGIDFNITTDDEELDGDETSVESRAPWQRPGASMAQVRRELQVMINKQVAEAFASAPEKYKGLKAVATVRVAPKSTGRTRDVHKAVIARILTYGGASATQSAISAEVAAAHPDLKAPKDWTKAMPRWAIESLRATIGNAAPPFNQLKVNSKTTLSSLHKEAKRVAATHSPEGVQIRAEIVVTADRVHINNRSWRISGAGQRIIVPVRHLLELSR